MFIAGSAFAGGSGPDWIDFWGDWSSDDVGGENYTLDNWFQNEDGTYTAIKNTTVGGGGLWSLAFEFTLDPTGAENGLAHYTIDGELVVTNNDTDYANFAFLSTMDIDDFVGVVISGNGSVGATVTNNDPFGGFAELTNAQDGGGADIPVYQGYLDGASARTMWDSSYSLMANGGAASAADADDFTRDILGPTSVDTIGVGTDIRLSPGDSATITLNFEIAVPGPAGFALFAAAGLVSRRRRRA